MTTYKTGNPIGSTDPKDLYDNAENFDVAVNSSNDTFVDRLGKERPTLKGGVDPRGLVHTAVNAKNEAIAARDAAFVNADVYPDVAAGRAAVAMGEQFQVVEGAEIVRYRNEPGSAVEVARYPASEFVMIAMDVASQPGLVSGEFYADDNEQPVFSITDEDGQALAAWNERGEMDANPSLDMAEKFQRARSEFRTSDDQPAFAMVDENGHQLYAVDENGQPIVPFISDFHTTPGGPLYAWTDTALRIFYAIDETGKSVIGGGGISGDSIPVRLAGTGAKEVYAQYNKLALTPSGDSFYGRVATSARSIVPNAQDMFDLLDDLVDEFPDYIERTLLGQDGIGNDIYQYRANPASYWTRWYDDNAPEVLAKPKIILFGATHGNEKEAALTNYKLLREICLRWREDERLSFLRWGADILLIPVLNPSGFNKSEEGRYNHNDVDINRNYPYGWTQTSRSGPYPASEMETQIALQVFADHPDACAIIDHHNAGSLNNADTPYAYWIGTERPETIELARMSCDHMMAYLRKEYPYVPQDNSRITRLVDSFNGTLAKHVQRELGFNGFTLEGGGGFAEMLDRERHELEALTNLITMCVKQENARRVRETTFTY